MTRTGTLTRDEKALRQAALSSLLEVTNAEKGNTLAFLNGTSGRWPEDRILRTGSLDLDMAIGIGGWPRGRVIEIYGAESSGKTTTMLHTVREAQKAGVGVVFIDAENALDPNYCRKLGVDLDLMLINQPDSLQQAQDLMAFLMANAAESLPNGLLIVVDSIPALAPMEVMEASAEQQTRAMAARYWSAQLPKLAKGAADSGSTIVLINQMRDSMDMYTAASTPGGRAIKFFASVRVEVKRKVEGKNQAEGSDGQTTTLKVVKNKVGSPFKAAEYWLPAGEPIDWASDVLSVAKYYGVVHEDKQFVDGELSSKKGWYTYILKDGDLELMKQDTEAYNRRLARRRAQVERQAEEERWASKDKKEALAEIGNDIDLYGDDTLAISKYREGAFNSEMAYYPSLIASIEEGVLDTLNQGTAIDPNNVDQFGDDEFDVDQADEPDGDDD